MRVSTTPNHKTKLGFVVLSVLAATVLVAGYLASTVNASSIVGVTSNVADVPGGDGLVLTISADNAGDIYELEFDHSLEGNPATPEFSVYASEADPYGGDGALFASVGVSVTYSQADSQWVIDFGPTMTQTMSDAASGEVTFYFVLKDATGNVLWGSMLPTTPENTFSYNLVDGSGDSLTPPAPEPPVVVEEPEPVVPGVPNTSAGRL